MPLRVKHVWVLVVCPLLGRKLKNMSRMMLIICTLKVAISFPWFSKELGLMSSGVYLLLKLIPPVSRLLSRPLLSSWIFNDFIFIISFTPDNDQPLVFFHTLFLLPYSALQHAGFPKTLQDQSPHCMAVVVTVLDTKRKFPAHVGAKKRTEARIQRVLAREKVLRCLHD